MKGRILIDVPQHGLVCGSYVDIPESLGKQLKADGIFDTQAPFNGVVTEESNESVHIPEKIVKRRKSP